MSAELEVSSEAHDKLSTLLTEHPDATAVRVMLKEDKCKGPSLLISLDAPREEDLRSEHDGVLYVIDRELMLQLEGVTVDFVTDERRAGFVIRAKAELNLRDNGCAGGCAC
jgi:Fe-S cluster assembly iron-binding protein IscA